MFCEKRVTSSPAFVSVMPLGVRLTSVVPNLLSMFAIFCERPGLDMYS